LRQRRNVALVALGALALIWGYNWVVMKIAVQYAPPFTFAAWRTFGGGVALAVAALALRKPLRPQYPAAFVWIGLSQTAGFVGLVTWAVVTAGAGQVAMLSYTMPFWVAMLAWPLLGERLKTLQGVAIAVAFAGIACMIGPLHDALADVLAVAAGLSWALGVILAKRLQQNGDVDLFNLTMWQMLFGGAALVVVAIFVPSHATAWTPTYVAALVYNILLATALAYLLWLFILDVLPARDASMGTLANPIIGVIAAWIVLREVPSPLEATGMILVVAGLVVLSFGERVTARE
jgi:drug/metabolite transporter (DMT)-like permease